MNETVATPKTKNELSVFIERMNELLESKYILADKHIASLLKCIVSLPILVDCAEKSMSGFSYAAEFARNKVSLVDGAGTRSKITLPIDKIRLFTFIFCLLAEIDSGKRDFTRFLNEFFYDENPNLSYQKFCVEVLRPFKRAGEYILREVDPESLDSEPLKKGENYFEAEKIYINTALLENLVTAIEKFKQKTDNDFPGNSAQKAECVEVANGLLNALLCKNPKLIALMWIAFKNTLLEAKGLNRDLNKIREFLIEGNLV